MSRYIDADALKAFIRNQYFQCDMPEEWGNGVMWATSQINHYCNKVAPSINIVRCKECKHWRNTDAEKIPTASIACGNMHADDFCSYGEREGE